MTDWFPWSQLSHKWIISTVGVLLLVSVFCNLSTTAKWFIGLDNWSHDHVTVWPFPFNSVSHQLALSWDVWENVYLGCHGGALLKCRVGVSSVCWAFSNIRVFGTEAEALHHKLLHYCQDPQRICSIINASMMNYTRHFLTLPMPALFLTK